MEAEKDLFLHLDVHEMEHKRPFKYDMAEGKPFIFATESARVPIQIESVTSSLRRWDQLRTMEEHCTQFGVLTGHCASNADFNRNSSYVSVS